jgi:hypothetical protein
MDDFHAFWLIIRSGIYHIHPIPFAVIAIGLGWMTRSYVSAFFGSILASAVYVAFEAFIPTVTDGKPFAMPHFNHAFWYNFMSLSIAFLVVMIAIHAVKSTVMAMRG